MSDVFGEFFPLSTESGLRRLQIKCVDQSVVGRRNGRGWTPSRPERTLAVRVYGEIAAVELDENGCELDSRAVNSCEKPPGV